MPSVSDTWPKALRIYRFNRLNLEPHDDSNWVADCPFCGKESKLSVHIEKGFYKCWSCEEDGNQYGFIRRMVELGKAGTTTRDYVEALPELELAGGKNNLLKVLRTWGLVIHPLSNEWCLPGHNQNGDVTGLYIWRKVPVKKVWKHQLRNPPGLGHHIFGFESADWESEEIDILEGWRDGVCWKAVTGRNCIAIPGTGSFKTEWAELFEGMKVNILFDNDHPTVNKQSGNLVQMGGPKGVEKVGSILLSADIPPAEVKYLKWGTEKTYNPDIPSGIDMRDLLRGAV